MRYHRYLPKKKLDDATLEELEDLLITSDLGVAAASEMTRNLAAKKFNRDINEEDIRVSFASDIANILKPFAKPIPVSYTHLTLPTILRV